MKKTYTLIEAVEQYGSETQKKALVKGKGNLNQRSVENIKKTLDTLYEEVKLVGRGKNKKFICDNKRDTPIRRIDKRRANGKWSNPYLSNLDIMIIERIRVGINIDEAKTLTKWCEYFGLIRERELSLFHSRYNEENHEELVENLILDHVFRITEKSILEDFYSYALQIKDHIYYSLNRLSKIDALEVIPIYKAKQYGSIDPITISEKVYQKAKNLEKELQSKFEITNFNVIAHRNSKKVRLYTEELRKSMNEIVDEDEDKDKKLNLSYVFIAYKLRAEANDDLLTLYYKEYKNTDLNIADSNLEKFWRDNKASFIENRKIFFENSADRALENFFKDRLFPLAIPELGGKRQKRAPRITDFPYDQEYYLLFFDRDAFVNRINRLANYFLDDI